MTLYDLIIPPDEPNPKVYVGPNDYGILLDRHFLVNGKISFKEIKTPINELSEDHILTAYGKKSAKQYWQSINRIKAKKNNNSTRDVFAPIFDGVRHDIPITIDGEVRKDKLFSCRLKARRIDEECLAVTFPNKSAYGFRCAQEGVVKEIKDNPTPERVFRGCQIDTLTTARQSPFEFKEGAGFQEIGPTPSHHLEAMFLNEKLTQKAFVEEAQSHGVKEIPVYFFINQGKQSGASQPRLHFQTIINLDGAGHEIRFESILQGFVTDNCRMCQSTHVDEVTGKSRLLYRNKTFDLWLASTPECDYHLRFAPKRHVHRFTDLTNDEIKGLADVLKFSDLVLTQAGVIRHRNINFYSLPYGYETPDEPPRFHFHGDLCPVQYFGALERFYAISIAYKDPLVAYEELKDSQKIVENNGLSSYNYDY